MSSNNGKYDNEHKSEYYSEGDGKESKKGYEYGRVFHKEGKNMYKDGRKILINLAAAVCLILSLGACSANGQYAGEERKIAYSADLTVSMTEKGLIGQLKGDTWDAAHTKRVDVEKDGQQLTYLFFYFSGNKWNTVFTDQNSYMEYTICPEDKGAGDVDYVYYYTGDYSGIEMMGYDQLQEVVDEAVLLWSSEEMEHQFTNFEYF